MLLFLYVGTFAEDRNSESELKGSQSVELSEAGNSDENPEKIKSDSKIKSFFKKLNPFKKAEDDFPKFLIAFLFGFLLGLIGILIAFLIYLKNENRKRIMSFAWLGWLWWLVIFSLILVL